MIKKNENYIMDITGMTHEGQGVGRVNGFAVFVDGALEGETVEARIIKAYKSYAIGKLVKVMKTSSDRLEPFCEVYKRCGGCALQHMNYSAQLKFKTNLVRESIKRIGRIETAIVHDAIGMKNPFGYRNKAQYPAALMNGVPAIGFYAKRTHNVIDSMTCLIQDEISDKVRGIVRDFIIEKGISVYDEETGKGLVRHIMTRTGYRTGEVMAVLVLNGNELPMKEEFVERLANGIEGIKSIVLNINKGNTNVILGDKSVTIYGNDYITDYIGRYKFRISPVSFFQVNPVQTEVLYGKALRYANLTGNETVFDLYCGIGTITLFLSEKAGKVIGVESVEDAVADARKNARLNRIDNVEFIAGEAGKVIQRLYREGIKADVVVVDPPRKGCEESLLETLAKMRLDRIVYVSCNPATLARDLKYLEEKGYKTLEVQPVDMFPWTGHVECVILMQRSGVEDRK